MRRVGNWLLAVTVVAVVALAVPAGADHTDQVDPNDTEGRLDLRGCAVRPRGRAELAIVTFPAWTVRAIWDRGYLMVQLDTRGDAAVDFVAVVRSDGRRLVAALFRRSRSGGQAEVASLRTDKSGSKRRLGIGPAQGGLDRTEPDLVLLVGALELHGRRLHAHLSGRRSRRGDDRTAAPGCDADADPDADPDHDRRPDPDPDPDPDPFPVRGAVGLRPTPGEHLL